jgi:hypothetical protein
MAQCPITYKFVAGKIGSMFLKLEKLATYIPFPSKCAKCHSKNNL